MKAIVIRGKGGPEALELCDRPDPVPGHGEVRIRVRAVGVNRADILQRMGLYPAPSDAPRDIPGLEFAGEVDRLGAGVTELAEGTPVFGITAGGAYAEYLIAHARTVVRAPEGWSLVDAAAVPEAFVTAYDAMVLQGGLQPGDTVLIHAVGSGVGTAAVQIAKALGATTIGTTRTKEKLERAMAMGLDAGVVVEGGAFADKVKELTHGRGVRVVLDLVGGAYLTDNLRSTKPLGTIVVVGLLGGPQAQLDLGALLQKRITLRGTVLRSRPLEEKILAARVLERHLLPLFEKGVLKPVVDRTFALSETREAHLFVQSNDGFGKVVIEMPVEG